MPPFSFSFSFSFRLVSFRVVKLLRRNEAQQSLGKENVNERARASYFEKKQQGGGGALRGVRTLCAFCVHMYVSLIAPVQKVPTFGHKRSVTDVRN